SAAFAGDKVHGHLDVVLDAVAQAVDDVVLLGLRQLVPRLGQQLQFLHQGGQQVLPDGGGSHFTRVLVRHGLGLRIQGWRGDYSGAAMRRRCWTGRWPEVWPAAACCSACAACSMARRRFSYTCSRCACAWMSSTPPIESAARSSTCKSLAAISCASTLSGSRPASSAP